MTIFQFGDRFRQYFHCDPHKFVWKTALLLFGKITIDLFELERWLESQKGYDKDKSIKDNITAMYGKDAAHWVESIL